MYFVLVVPEKRLFIHHSRFKELVRNVYLREPADTALIGHSGPHVLVFPQACRRL